MREAYDVCEDNCLIFSRTNKDINPQVQNAQLIPSKMN